MIGLYVALTVACAMLALRIFGKPLAWLVESVEAKHRIRHARRRRKRAKGYLPVFDDRWEPRR